jgi:hypothetical protein
VLGRMSSAYSDVAWMPFCVRSQIEATLFLPAFMPYASMPYTLCDPLLQCAYNCLLSHRLTPAEPSPSAPPAQNDCLLPYPCPCQ